MWDYIEPLIDERTTNPREDLISRIARAELNGRKMNTLEIKGSWPPAEALRAGDLRSTRREVDVRGQ